ncbi:MAG: O-antigen ligase family protein [Candidatus Saccharibacteria bacterium]|nr:O-antigen ligase family protein [Candidatus Saccharibacteria bacterium]
MPKQQKIEQTVVPFGASILSILATTSLLGGMYYWSQDLYKAFWLRRFFIGAAGVIAFLYLVLYRREILKNIWKDRKIPLFVFLSTVVLLLNSITMNALIGTPLVHPSLVSLYASIAVGTMIATIERTKMLIGAYLSICGWAVVNFVFWLQGHSNTRLGFIDSQVIYAACLFAIGILLGLWLYRHKKVNPKYLVPSIIFLCLCLLLSQTRSALIILAGLIIYDYRYSFKRYLKILILSSLVALTLLFVRFNYFSRLANTPYFVESVLYRLNLVQASMPKPKGFILGEGIGSIDRNIHDNGKKYPRIGVDVEDGIRFESSHNYFVDLVVERGVIITGLFIYLLYSALRGLRNNSSANTVIRSVLWFMILFLAVNNINIQMEVILWICIILGIAKPTYVKKLKKETPKKLARV